MCKVTQKKSSIVDKTVACALYLLAIELWKQANKSEPQPSLIHSHSSLFGGFLGVKIGKKFNIPVVLTEHSSSLEPARLSPRGLRTMNKVVALSNVVVGVSEYQCKKIAKLYSPKREISLIYNFIDYKFFTIDNQPTNDIPIILTISGLGKIKNIQLLLEAFAILINFGLNAKLLMKKHCAASLPKPKRVGSLL